MKKYFFVTYSCGSLQLFKFISLGLTDRCRKFTRFFIAYLFQSVCPGLENVCIFGGEKTQIGDCAKIKIRLAKILNHIKENFIQLLLFCLK